MKIKKCPECNNEVEENSLYCSNCGYPFENNKVESDNSLKEKVCPECKAKINDDLSQCPYCGFPFEQTKEKTVKQNNTSKINNVVNSIKDDVKIKLDNSTLTKVMAVLMLIYGLFNVVYIITFLSYWLGNLFDLEIFSLDTLCYFLYMIDSVATTAGFILTAMVILMTKKQEYLKAGTLLIVVSYALRVIGNIIICIDWFDGSILLSVIISILILGIWCYIIFAPKSNNDVQIKTIRIALIVASVVLFVVGFVGRMGSFLQMLIETVILILFILCTLQSENEIKQKQTHSKNDNNSPLNQDNVDGQYRSSMNVESIYGYVKIWKLIVFSILILGIYTYVWIYRTVGLFNQKGIGEERSQGVQVVLCMFVPFYSIYWIYKQSKLTEEYTLRIGNRSNDLAIISLILSIVGLSVVAMLLIQDQVNKNLMYENGIYERNENVSEIQNCKVVDETIKQVDVTKDVQLNKTADRISDTDIEYLKKLKELNDMGILSEEEFKKERDLVLKK